MKKVFIVALLLIFSLSATLTSCTKENSNYELDIDSPDKDKVDPPGGNS